VPGCGSSIEPIPADQVLPALAVGDHDEAMAVDHDLVPPTVTGRRPEAMRDQRQANPTRQRAGDGSGGKQQFRRRVEMWGLRLSGEMLL
jgi:hypothetical protein